MKKLKINPVILDTMSNEDLKNVIGGSSSGTVSTSVYTQDPDTTPRCKLCTVQVSPKL